MIVELVISKPESGADAGNRRQLRQPDKKEKFPE